MTQKNDGGPAFPINPETNMSHKGDLYEETCGMSLRDWFAGQVLAGMSDLICKEDHPIELLERPGNIAQLAYVYADAMLAAREKGGDA